MKLNLCDKILISIIVIVIIPILIIMDTFYKLRTLWRRFSED